MVSQIKKYKEHMGWTMPWYSSHGSSFNRDFGITMDKGKVPGLSVFVRDGARVFRTYFTTQRGIELLGSTWTQLDLTPWGRQESWEESPEGRPQRDPDVWWRRHDEYGE